MSMEHERLRIALTKGRLQDRSVELFAAMGLDCSPIQHPGRRLVHSIPNYPLDAVLAKSRESGFMRCWIWASAAAASPWR